MPKKYSKVPYNPVIYTADFETTTAKYSETESRVWLVAACRIDLYDKDNSVYIFYNIGDFLSWAQHKAEYDDIELWYHNLKFDGNFILPWLLNNGYTWVEDVNDAGAAKKRFHTIISDAGTWYEIEIKNFRHTIKIKNSACLIAQSVKEIGDSFKTRKRKLDMDYDNDAELDPRKVSTQSIEYIKADVQVMAEVMNTLINDYKLGQLTAAANAMHDYIERTFVDMKKFRIYFPELSNEVDGYIRNAYAGGISYVNSKLVSKIHSSDIARFGSRYLLENPYFIKTHGITCDRNSMYPSEMHSSSGNLYPIGEPVWFTGAPQPDKERPLWVARVLIKFSLKRNKFPCLQLKKDFRYNEHEWLEKVDTPIEKTITSVDWDTIQECYNIEWIQWLDGYKFAATCGIFDKFIDYWYDIKRTSKGAKKQLAKLMLNSFYGKFGTRLTGKSKIPEMGPDGVIKFSLSDEEQHKAYYIPVACFVTAYARRCLIRAANANADRFIYADTDSVHLTGYGVPKGIKLHDSDLGAWKVESYWDAGVFVRQKTYMEHAADSPKAQKKWSVRCAGLPDNLRKGYYTDASGNVLRDKNGDRMSFCKISPHDFNIGLRFETGKLIAKIVKGGVLLMDTPFEIKPVS